MLFIVEGSRVMPHPETLLVSPFNKIWERDKSKDKKKALAEFAYIEFCTSMLESNPYKQYTEIKKPVVVQEAVIFMKGWKPDAQIFAAMKVVQVFMTEASTTYTYYMAAKRAAEKMQAFFREVDVNERDLKTGKPIWKPRDITSALNDTGKTLATLKDLEKKVHEEIYETMKTKADKKISIFANPESLDQ
jgi:hypothetical protein